MSNYHHRHAVVTGASSGIGRATAQALSEAGYAVTGTCRDPQGLGVADRIPGVTYHALDLTDAASIEQFAAGLETVSVLVNNAGESQCGALEDTPIDDIRRLFEINVFGAVHLTQLLLPVLRAERGRVIVVGSMLASFPLAYRGAYVASKAAISGIAAVARNELTPHGVEVIVVEPGSVATGIRERRTEYSPHGSLYERDYDTVVAALNRNENNGVSAKAVAKVIAHAANSPSTRAFYPVGRQARATYAVRRLLPTSWVNTLVHRRHGVVR
ncbi:SDR family NAD(P)-dependent oxidoreductase [Rhodococcus qingshengii]|uniref:SDR family NAD(P)-dependent oxidoreductase n=1 Tax=Rhodococcus qingshengii TaxID=334542 RepID=UPI00237C57E5|nr:SDR family NAD(P)-dependent oxidoreductase [Rhodococcus qingshengii]WCT05833.1 SDR family NAD(P)-dependent oxidoreductase [Rhodococcus qingshengii]